MSVAHELDAHAEPPAPDQRQLLDCDDAEHLDFAGLDIVWDPRVLRPRPWTAEQGRWAAELGSGSDGPMLELCCGA